MCEKSIFILIDIILAIIIYNTRYTVRKNKMLENSTNSFNGKSNVSWIVACVIKYVRCPCYGMACITMVVMLKRTIPLATRYSYRGIHNTLFRSKHAFALLEGCNSASTIPIDFKIVSIPVLIFCNVNIKFGFRIHCQDCIELYAIIDTCNTQSGACQVCVTVLSNLYLKQLPVSVAVVSNFALEPDFGEWYMYSGAHGLHNVVCVG